MLPFIALLCFLAFSDASVSFTNSIIYDEYDLNGKTEITLDKCSVGGCSIYVSVPTWNTEVTKNLFVYSKTGTNTSLYSFASQVDVNTGAKSGLHLSNTEYSIMNYNTADIRHIIIYVVGSQDPFYNSPQVEIYDASNINSRPAKNKMNTMIMSADPYNLFVQAYGSNLKAFVRATGYDSNMDRNAAGNCRIIYDHNEGKPFRLRINSPIISINFDGAYNYQICAKIDTADNKALLDYRGMATSQGYVGCASNLYQNWRSSNYNSAPFELADSAGTDRDTELTYVANVKNSDTLTITTFTQKDSSNIKVTGDGSTPVTVTKAANKITVVGTIGYGSSYWMGYTPKTGAISIPSGQGICPDFADTTTPAGVTQPPQNPTTSGSNDVLTLLTSAIVCFFARQF